MGWWLFGGAVCFPPWLHLERFLRRRDPVSVRDLRSLLGPEVAVVVAVALVMLIMLVVLVISVGSNDGRAWRV